MTEQTVSPDAVKPAKVTHKGMRHQFAGMKTEKFFEHIDACGGWPLDYPFVGFAHSDERGAAFTMEPTNHGWWTTLYHRDDYLMWKLSPEAWGRIFDGVRDQLVKQLSYVKAQPYGPSVKGWRSQSSTVLHPEFERRALKAIIAKATP